MQAELNASLEVAYEEFPMSLIQPIANLMEVVFKAKRTYIKFNLNARLTSRSHRGYDRYLVCLESASKDLFVFRAVHSLATILNFSIVQAGIKGAYT